MHIMMVVQPSLAKKSGYDSHKKANLLVVEILLPIGVAKGV